MCLLRIHLPKLCPNMNHLDAVDFSECHSEEVISFFWRSVYNKAPGLKGWLRGKQIEPQGHSEHNEAKHDLEYINRLHLLFSPRIAWDISVIFWRPIFSESIFHRFYIKESNVFYVCVPKKCAHCFNRDPAVCSGMNFK